MLFLPRLAAVISLGAFVALVACSGGGSGSDANATATQDFGCCADVKTGCTLLRYGKKTSADDACIVGYDGVVPDTEQPGWTHSTTADGCAVWSPPPNFKTIQCGVARPVDAGSDAATDASDASVDASITD